MFQLSTPEFVNLRSHPLNLMKVKLIVTVPETHADLIREVIGKTGLDKVGPYGFCSFSTKGIGRFMPLTGAKPAIGSVDALEEVIEDRIEIGCTRDHVEAIITAIRTVHPYEEPVIDVYPLES